MEWNLWINGQWVETGKRFDVENPATREIIARVAYGAAKEARMAVDAAEEALPAWRSKSAYERAAVR